MDSNTPATVDDLIQALEARMPHLDNQQRLVLFEMFCRTLGRHYILDHEFRLKAFDAAEKHGLHLTPVHYFSPIPTAEEVRASTDKPLFGSEFGVAIDVGEQLRFLRRSILPFAHELHDVASDKSDDGTYFWNNGMFAVQDGLTYYGMIRAFKPKRVIEVGSGFSTLIAAKAAQRNAVTHIQCIEPYPDTFFGRHLRRQDGYELIEKPVQQIDLAVFATLEADDILFLDSSHVLKPSSDVEYLIFRVLPALRPGVVVHFHDIFMPDGYRDPYYLQCHWFWNENYMLAGLLANNPEWRVLLGSHITRSAHSEIARAVTQREEQAARIRQHVGGSSFWMQKRLPSQRRARSFVQSLFGDRGLELVARLRRAIGR